MTITKETVRRLAHLARIEFDDDQAIESIQDDLTRIVSMIDQISTANTEKIEGLPCSSQPLRKDKVEKDAETETRDALLALAPKAEAGLYLVPPMIEEA